MDKGNLLFVYQVCQFYISFGFFCKWVDRVFVIFDIVKNEGDFLKVGGFVDWIREIVDDDVLQVRVNW